jgi:hypothetical protein
MLISAGWLHKVERRVEALQSSPCAIDDDRFVFLGPKIKPPTLASISESHHLERGYRSLLLKPSY